MTCLQLCFTRRNPHPNGIYHLEQKGLRALPEELCRWAAEVTELWLQDNQLIHLDKRLASATKIELLYLNKNEGVSLDAVMAAQWTALQELNLSGCKKVECLPDTAGAWVDLRQIYLNDLPMLRQLGPVVASWSRLKVLHVNCSGLVELGEEVGSLVSLTQVSICNNPLLQALPRAVRSWESVEKIFLNDNSSLKCLPGELGDLRSLEKLYVNNCALEHLPMSLGKLEALEELYVANNKIRLLPGSLVSCRSLNKIHAPDNEIAELPSAFSPALELLNLSRNRIQRVPAETVSSIPRLKFLHLADNAITDFPFASLDLPPLDGGRVGALRIFDVEGNTELMSLHADEVAAVKSRLVKPWKFDSR
mmetsp:Transcript_83690/g.162756  ORF Transcript_83690/g.162756 Transcript_83690/m.162756 type:complete len:364 (+) Transcript_83690:31-1122(+)